jgi:hypothetical protein
LAGYYRCFIPDFSRIAKPMTELLKKGVKFVWSEVCDNAFQKLGEHLTSTQCYCSRTIQSHMKFIVMLQAQVLAVFLCKKIGLLPMPHERFALMKRIIPHMT